MRIRFASALVALLFLVDALPSQAQCPIVVRVVHDVARDWKRNNCWPEPFVCPDRLAVRAPFEIMVQNGWRRQNLLADDHFQADTGVLTPAGEEKVRWILLEAPEQHRMIFVRKARQPNETAARVASVEAYGAKTVEDGTKPEVSETNLPPVGWPAERVDVIERKFQDSMPQPRLPAASSVDTGT